MQCPRCGGNGLRDDQFFCGNGSTENRQSGKGSIQLVTCQTCVLCGHYVEIQPETKPITELMKHPNSKTEAYAARKADEAAGVPREKRKKVSDVMVKCVVEKFKKSIAAELKRGTSWESIAKLIGKASTRAIKPHVLQRVWAAVEL